MNNKLIITDLHVGRVQIFSDLFYEKNFNHVQDNIEYGLVMNDNKNPNIDIYFLGDTINNINPSNINDSYLKYLAYLFHIKVFLERNNFKLNKAFYVLGNHEYYVAKGNMYSLEAKYILNIKKHIYIHDDEKYFKRKEFNDFYKMLEKANFAVSTEKEDVYEHKTLFFPEEKTNLFVKFENVDIFNIKDDYIHLFIQEGIKDIFNLGEQEIINLIKTDGVLEGEKLILGNTLFSPFLGKYIENNTNESVEDIYYISDTIFWKSFANEGRFSELLKEDFDKSKVNAEVYEDFCKVKKVLKTFNTKDTLFGYLVCHFLFYYHYLLIMETLHNNKDKGIKEIDLLTHFPFNYFTQEGIKGFNLKSRNITKEEQDRQKYFAKRALNTYFNVDVSYLDILLDYIMANYKDIKKINLYNGHTHIRHKDIWKGKVEINIINPSVELFFDAATSK